LLAISNLQQFLLGWETAPELEPLAIKHSQIKLYSAAVRTAVECA